MIVWSLGVKPSDLEIVYWSHSFNDLKEIIKIKVQYRIVEKEQELENLFKVASAIFGKSDSTTDDNVNVIDTLDGAMAFMRQFKSG